MIIGQGMDMVDIRRIERILDCYGDRFIRRIFTERERELAGRRRLKSETFAKRFAAREACAKALGTGIPGRGVYWRQIGVVNCVSGAPCLELSGGARARLEELTPPGFESVVHLSLSDEYPYALAQVIIEALRASG